MAARRRPPRHFLYLDHEIAESYLSGLIGWLPEEGSSTDRSSDSRNREAKLGFRATGYARGRGEESSSEDTEKFRYTPAAVFDHLYRELDAEVDGERMLIHLQSLNEDGWKSLRNGDIVELTGTLKVPDVMKVIEVARGLGKFMPLLESLGAAGEIEMTQEDRIMMSGHSM